MKKIKNIPKLKRLIYPLSIIIFYGIGSFVCSVKFSPDTLFGNYFYGIITEQGISFVGFLKGWLYHLIPFLVIFLSGYDFLGKWYSITALGIRSYISGYSGSACVGSRLVDKTIIGVCIFILFTLVEAFILILLLSGAIEQDKFRVYYSANSKHPFKSGVNKIYIKHNFQRCGVLILLYILRSTICYLI